MNEFLPLLLKQQSGLTCAESCTINYAMPDKLII